VGGAITDTSGVFYFLLHQPLGPMLLGALALGLFAYDPSRAGGIRAVLRTLAGFYASGWLLGLVALGLVAFGIFGLVEARYRVIPGR
jgi:hypothetical protein